jgi:hypothetical protein
VLLAVPEGLSAAKVLGNAPTATAAAASASAAAPVPVRQLLDGEPLRGLCFHLGLFD